MENKADSKVQIDNVYYNLYYQKQYYYNPKKSNFTIDVNDCDEKEYMLNENLREKHVVIRHIITYTYRNKQYNTSCTNIF